MTPIKVDSGLKMVDAPAETPVMSKMITVFGAWAITNMVTADFAVTAMTIHLLNHVLR